MPQQMYFIWAATVVLAGFASLVVGYLVASKKSQNDLLELELANSELDKLSTVTDEQKAQLVSLNDSMREMELNLGIVRSEKETTSENIKRLSQDLTDALEAKEKSYNQRQQAQNEQVKAIAELDNIKLPYEELKSTHKNLDMELQQTKGVLNDLHISLSKSEAQLKSVSNSSEQNKDALETLKKNHDSVLNERNTKSNKIVELETELESQLQQHSRLTQQLNELKGASEDLRVALKDSQEQNTQLKSNLSESTANLQAVIKERDSLQKRIDEALATQNTLRKDWSNAQQKNVELETEQEASKVRVSDLLAQLQELKKELVLIKSHYAESQKSNTGLKARLSESEAKFSGISEQYNERKQDLISLQKSHELILSERNELKEKSGLLAKELTTKQEHYAEQMQLLQDSKKELKKEFENLANEILERKGRAFKDLNTESMSKILSPIHDELKGFKSKVEDIHSKESEQRVQLRTELENLQKLNREITDQADKLTTALRGQKKVQGNWGELMLENVLDNAGLQLGSDYKREVTFDTEDGKRRPDVVVYLPQNKHLVIDAKTSLNAYTRYVNSDNDSDREMALIDHTIAIRDRLNELADKDYWKLPGLNSPEVVIMFIPIESAYVEALKADESLFQTALEQNILIATPTTLLTSLNIVRQLWRFEEQNKHTAELASRAEKFYSKLTTFLTSMDKVGKQLDTAKDTYEKAYGQLYTGKGNLIKQAAEFKELGVSVKNELPTQLVDKAKLELGAVQLEDFQPISAGHEDLEKVVN